MKVLSYKYKPKGGVERSTLLLLDSIDHFRKYNAHYCGDIAFINNQLVPTSESGELRGPAFTNILRFPVE